jgi:hypothetical protein
LIFRQAGGAPPLYSLIPFFTANYTQKTETFKGTLRKEDKYYDLVNTA